MQLLNLRGMWNAYTRITKSILPPQSRNKALDRLLRLGVEVPKLEAGVVGMEIIFPPAPDALCFKRDVAGTEQFAWQHHEQSKQRLRFDRAAASDHDAVWRNVHEVADGFICAFFKNTERNGHNVSLRFSFCQQDFISTV